MSAASRPFKMPNWSNKRAIIRLHAVRSACRIVSCWTAKRATALSKSTRQLVDYTQKACMPFAKVLRDAGLGNARNLGTAGVEAPDADRHLLHGHPLRAETMRQRASNLAYRSSELRPASFSLPFRLARNQRLEGFQYGTRLYPRSRARNRAASDTIRPPYLDCQLQKVASPIPCLRNRSAVFTLDSSARSTPMIWSSVIVFAASFISI